MVKLQLRLDQDQTDTIIKALSAMVAYPGIPDEAAAARRLESWLIWRRSKVWGPSADASERVTASEALDQLRAKLSK